MLAIYTRSWLRSGFLALSRQQGNLLNLSIGKSRLFMSYFVAWPCNVS